MGKMQLKKNSNFISSCQKGLREVVFLQEITNFFLPIDIVYFPSTSSTSHQYLNYFNLKTMIRYELIANYVHMFSKIVRYKENLPNRKLNFITLFINPKAPSCIFWQQRKIWVAHYKWNVYLFFFEILAQHVVKE